MANITVTYTFVNATVASASEVNQNFTDIINGTSDGTKSFNVAAITATSLNVSDNVTLGSSSADDLTLNASLASNIVIKTQRTYDIGSADIGLRILYLGGNSTHTIALQAPSSGMAADYSLNLPATAPVVGFGVQGSSTSATVWAPMQTDINSVSSADYTVTDTDGYGVLLMTTGNSNRTVTLPTAADNTDRKIIIKKVDSGTGTVIIDGEGSETVDGSTTYILYGQYRQATVVCDGSNWHIIEKSGGSLSSEVRLSRGNGHGSTNNKIRRFTTTVLNQGTAITYADSSTDGASFTINHPGKYSMFYVDFKAAGDGTHGFSRNSNQLTTAVYSITNSHRIVYCETPSGSTRACASATLELAAGDVIRPHTDGNPDVNTDENTMFGISLVTPY